jgi:hypothetical protein
VILKHPFDRFRFHLTASIIDDLRTLVLRQIEDVLSDKTTLQEASGFLGSLMPTDKPMDGFARIFIQE